MGDHRRRLRRNPDFVKLWAAHTLSLCGSQITLLAVPLTAVLVLKATPLQMGLLRAAAWAPFLVVGLIAGLWIDRRPRQPILIAMDLGRAVLLSAIPLGAFVGLLGLGLLYVVVGLLGTLTVFFEVAAPAFLSSLLVPEDILEGNSRLQASASLAQVIGPGVAGVLVQVLTAPMAVAVDALSFVLSAVLVRNIRAVELLSPSRETQPLWDELSAGVRLIVTNPILRAVTGCSSTLGLWSSLVATMYVLYITQTLGLQPAALGLIVMVGSAGGILGAVVAGTSARRFGLGHIMIGATLLDSAATLLIPLAGRAGGMTVPLLVGAQALVGLTFSLYFIPQTSLRQLVTPIHVQGRANAAYQLFAWGSMSVGSLLGGVLGQRVGLQSTLVIGAVGMCLSSLWLIASPVRHLHEQPAPLPRASSMP